MHSGFFEEIDADFHQLGKPKSVERVFIWLCTSMHCTQIVFKFIGSA